MERMEALGVSARSGRDELDCYIRYELDDGAFLVQGVAYSFRVAALRSESNFPARCLWPWNHVDLLAIPVLDVPPENLPENLTAINSPFQSQFAISPCRRKNRDHLAASQLWDSECVLDPSRLQ